MGLGKLLIGTMDIDGIVNDYIDTIFTQIAKRQNCNKTDMEFIMKFDGKNGSHASKYIAISRDGGLRKEWFFLPDSEIRKLIMNAKT
jgi:hypothetical protein